MSCHHIVRQNQEPALIIANGQACNFELLGQLLEWSPFIIVLDGALHRVLDLGIHFDVVLGDFDSISDADRKRVELLGIKLVHAPNQEKTDLQKGLDYLIEHEHSAVNIVWATGLRADHSFNNICTLGWYKDKIQATILDDHSRIYVLPLSFTKKFNTNDILSLIPLGKVSGIHSTGLQYPLNDHVLSTDTNAGSSNKVVGDGLVTIQYKTGTLLAMECIDL